MKIEKCFWNNDFWFVGENFIFLAFIETLLKENLGYSIEGQLWYEGENYNAILFFVPKEDGSEDIFSYWHFKIEEAEVQIEGDKIAITKLNSSK